MAKIQDSCRSNEAVHVYSLYGTQAANSRVRPAGNSLDVCHVEIGADTSNITNTVSTFAGKRLI